jgi:hypothetical protein
MDHSIWWTVGSGPAGSLPFPPAGPCSYQQGSEHLYDQPAPCRRACQSRRRPGQEPGARSGRHKATGGVRARTPTTRARTPPHPLGRADTALPCCAERRRRPLPAPHPSQTGHCGNARRRPIHQVGQAATENGCGHGWSRFGNYQNRTGGNFAPIIRFSVPLQARGLATTCRSPRASVGSKGQGGPDVVTGPAIG